MNSLNSYVNLSDICEFINGDRGKNYPSGKDFVQKGIPFINAGHIVNNKINLENMNYITKEKYESLGSGKIQNGDILYCLRGSLGKNAIVDIDMGAIASSLVILRPKKNLVDSDFLLKYLNSRGVEEQINRFNNGSSQPNLSAKNVKEFKVFLPNYDSQKKIAKILNKSQELINKRKEQIEALDELVKSQFIEMFGDPALNPKGWEKGRISDIIIKTQYGTSSKADEQKCEFKVIRMNNITYNGQWDFSSMKYVDLNEKDKEKYLVYKGEVLFNRTNSKELVGKTAVYKEEEPMAYAGYLVKAIPNERATGEFISAYMNTKYIKSKLFNMAKNIVGMANINAEEFKKIDVYIPPIELQNEYIKFVEQVDKLKFDLQKSLKELEDNFNSLMQKAFKGELFKDM